MLIIRKEQIQHLIAVDDGQLVKVIRQAVRQSNTQRVSSWEDLELENMVKIGVGRAKSHDLAGAEDIAAFVAVMFETAPRFDEQEEIRQVLDDTLFTPDARFYQLFERVSDEAWNQAETLYEDSFWFPANDDAKRLESVEKESENERPDGEQPIDYKEKIARQAELVKNLEDEFAKTPSDDAQLELKRKTDELRYLTNAAKGNTKHRARQAAEIARSVTLNRAIL